MPNLNDYGSPTASTSCTVRASKIPYTAVAKELVEFLNTIIGTNTVFACKIQTERINWKSKGFGVVQFETEEAALKAISLAEKCILKFQRGILQMEFATKNIRDRPDVIFQTRRLHMGCIISTNVFYVLWSTDRVTIELDSKNEKLIFILCGCNDSAKYKLIWSFENLEIVSSPSLKGQQADHMLIKTITAPKIRRQIPKDKREGKPLLSDRYSFFKQTSEDPEVIWSRDTDFTENQSIGQSFAYYIENPTLEHEVYKDAFNILLKHRISVSQCSEEMLLEMGVSYSLPHGLVPLLGSPDICKLPFDLIFKINSLVQHGIFTGPKLQSKFFNMLHPSSTLVEHTMMALGKISDGKEICYNPEELFKNQVRSLPTVSISNILDRQLDEGQMHVYRLTVTPTRVYCTGPEVDVSNHVIRHHLQYMKNFLRVCFTEEDMGSLSSRAMMFPVCNHAQVYSKPRHTGIYHRISKILKEGIEIGGKKFEFLAFSASQLREHSVWMFAATESTSADSIRKWMGDFKHIKNVAKCAVRMGQSFSTSIKTLDVYEYEVENIPDIERQVGNVKYCFSDGIGKICPTFAAEVATKCGYKSLRRTPSAFQIRYSGYKGVVAVDPTSLHKLSLRKSMKKFPSSCISLNVLDCTHFIPCYLNRQIITLLSTLGIADSVFEEMQKERISHLGQLFANKDVAIEIIEASCGGELHKIMVEMLTAGYNPCSEPFLKSMLQSFKRFQIEKIMNKSKIFVPKGRCLMGCLDESAALEYGEVFIQISATNRKDSHDEDSTQFKELNDTNDTPFLVQGRVVVARNPCLHPGDIRIVHAVNSSHLQHMVDCVVFPQKGIRPHPNECSGGDLDGDLYFVTWDEKLIPPEMETPMDYHPPEPITLDHSPTLQEIQSYFVDYISNDSLGAIANAHVVFADKEPEKARSSQCREIAEIFSVAVDFPKTGVPAILPKELRPDSYPDFMANDKYGKRTYFSSGILGKLYRAAREAACLHADATSEDHSKFYDEDLVVCGFEGYVENALRYRKLYNEKMIALMEFYGVQSEAEMFTGFFKLCPTFNNKSKDVDNRIEQAFFSLKKEVCSWFDDKTDTSDKANFAKASAWYHVTYHPEFVETCDHERYKVPLIGFPWMIHDKLLKIKISRQKMRHVPRI